MSTLLASLAQFQTPSARASAAKAHPDLRKRLQTTAKAERVLKSHIALLRIILPGPLSTRQVAVACKTYPQMILRQLIILEGKGYLRKGPPVDVEGYKAMQWFLTEKAEHFLLDHPLKAKP